MLRTAMTLSLSLAALGVQGCSRPVDGQSASDNPVGPAARPFPQRTPGLWRQQVLTPLLRAPEVTKVCISSETDALLSWWSPASRKSCAKDIFLKRDDGSWEFDADCKLGSIRTVQTGSIVGDFARRYQLTASVTTSGSADPRLNGTIQVYVDGERLGDCPADMRPGDVEQANGVRLNVVDELRRSGIID